MILDTVAGNRIACNIGLSHTWENPMQHVLVPLPSGGGWMGEAQSSLFQNSQLAMACMCSISSPFFTTAPCSAPRRMNWVSSGL